MALALSETEHKANDDIVTRLKDLKKDLEAKVWPAATEVAAEYDEHLITRLVELKARIDALDWALKARPSRPARSVRISGF